MSDMVLNSNIQLELQKADAIIEVLGDIHDAIRELTVAIREFTIEDIDDGE